MAAETPEGMAPEAYRAGLEEAGFTRGYSKIWALPRSERFFVVDVTEFATVSGARRYQEAARFGDQRHGLDVSDAPDLPNAYAFSGGREVFNGLEGRGVSIRNANRIFIVLLADATIPPLQDVSPLARAQHELSGGEAAPAV